MGVVVVGWAISGFAGRDGCNGEEGEGEKVARGSKDKGGMSWSCIAFGAHAWVGIGEKVAAESIDGNTVTGGIEGGLVIEIEAREVAAVGLWVLRRGARGRQARAGWEVSIRRGRGGKIGGGRQHEEFSLEDRGHGR